VSIDLINDREDSANSLGGDKRDRDALFFPKLRPVNAAHLRDQSKRRVLFGKLVKVNSLRVRVVNTGIRKELGI
jgi:hypothetical protein